MIEIPNILYISNKKTTLARPAKTPKNNFIGLMEHENNFLNSLCLLVPISKLSLFKSIDFSMYSKNTTAYPDGNRSLRILTGLLPVTV